MPILLLLLKFFAGFVFLVGGAELLIRGASRLAARLHVPEVVIGLTIVAFGTSLPELMVSLTAVFGGEGGSEIAIGNVVGSNIANLGLILGLAGMVAVLGIKATFPKREIPILLGVTVVFSLIAFIMNGIDRWIGGAFVIALVGFTYYSYRSAKTEQAYQASIEDSLDAAATIDDQIAQPSRQIWFDVLLLVMGLGGLVLGANWLVDAALAIAQALGVPDLIIGLTLVAIGTSLPEMATSLVAVFRGNGDIAIGNVVGSNMVNILGILGITALLKPIPLPPGMLIDFAFMIALTGLVWSFAWRKPHVINRREAAILLATYAVYCLLLVVRSL